MQLIKGISKHQVDFICRTIHHYLPGTTIIAFGSRVGGHPKNYSDLDVAFRDKDPVSLQIIDKISEAFSSSDLVFKVDLIDYSRVSEEFQSIIREAGVELSYS